MKKKTLIIALLTFIGHYGFTQAYTNNFDPAKDVNIVLEDQFAGKWEWVSDNRSFTLVLSRNNKGVDNWIICGWYSFVVNGKVIINQLDKTDSVRYCGLAGIVAKGNDSIMFTYTDLARAQKRHGTINFVDKNKDQILIKLKKEKIYQSSNHFNIAFGGKKKEEYTEKLPEDMNIILTRVL